LAHGGDAPGGWLTAGLKTAQDDPTLMYWRSDQYPVLKNHPPGERPAIVRAAVRRYGRAFSRRFLLALATLVGVVLSGAYYLRPRSVLDLRVWGVAAAAGALFNVYLLWEINGTILAAVERYVAGEAGQAKAEKQKKGRWRRRR
jgi:hypothetical protein